jgi:hypothetical protein
MPSKSKKQHNLMAMVAHDPKAAKRLGISQDVGKEFIAADKGKKFGTGGDVKYTFGGKNQVNKQRTRGGSTFGYQKEVPNVNINKYAGLKEGGMALSKLFKGKESYSEELKEAKAIKSGKITPQEYARGEKMEKEVKVKMKKGGSVKCMAKGGGCEVKGKTKGRMV